MAAAEGVGSAEHHNLLVVESHAAEDLPDGGGRLGVGSCVSLESNGQVFRRLKCGGGILRQP